MSMSKSYGERRNCDCPTPVLQKGGDVALAPPRHSPAPSIAFSDSSEFSLHYFLTSFPEEKVCD